MTLPWVLAFALQWVVIVLLFLLVLGVLRRQVAAGSPSPALVTRLKIGDARPIFEASRSDGSVWSSSELGDDSVLLVASAECPACIMALGALGDMENDLLHSVEARPSVTVLFLPTPTAPAPSVAFAELSAVATLVDDTEGAGMSAIGIRGVPTGLRFANGGRLVDVSLNPHAGWLAEQLGCESRLPDGYPIPIMTVE